MKRYRVSSIENGWLNLDARVLKRGIRQAESEWEEWLDKVLLVTSITDKDAFAIRNGVRMRIDRFRKRGVSRIIFDSFFECDRQFTGRIHVAEQNFGKRLAAVLTRVKGLQEAANLINPFSRIEVSTSVKHHDPWVDLGKVLDYSG
jgi:hypothetical protein